MVILQVISEVTMGQHHNVPSFENVCSKLYIVQDWYHQMKKKERRIPGDSKAKPGYEERSSKAEESPRPGEFNH